MEFRTRLLNELRAQKGALCAKRCLVGFDGFVDTIVSPVARRSGPGEAFAPFATIAEFGKRITEAAGLSTNLEFYPRLDKLGGNGPIMAGALASQGAQVTCIGAFGQGSIHPAFQPLAQKARLISLCEPARTTAVEFTDGKLMLGMMKSLDEITPAAISAALKGAYAEAVSAADLMVLGNWTMVPNMTAVFRDLTENVLPKAKSNPNRLYFFDLADPEKRSPADLMKALEAISAFSKFGRVTLGLNLSEAKQVFSVLGFGPESEAPDSLKLMAARIRDRLELGTVVIHPKESAACASREGAWWVPGPYVAQPLITTGAGDHFNAGFASGQLVGLSPEACLGNGVCTSGHYVRTAQSPSGEDLERFLANWA